LIIDTEPVQVFQEKTVPAGATLAGWAALVQEVFEGFENLPQFSEPPTYWAHQTRLASACLGEVSKSRK